MMTREVPREKNVLWLPPPNGVGLPHHDYWNLRLVVVPDVVEPVLPHRFLQLVGKTKLLDGQGDLKGIMSNDVNRGISGPKIWTKLHWANSMQLEKFLENRMIRNCHPALQIAQKDCDITSGKCAGSCIFWRKDVYEMSPVDLSFLQCHPSIFFWGDRDNAPGGPLNIIQTASRFAISTVVALVGAY